MCAERSRREFIRTLGVASLLPFFTGCRGTPEREGRVDPLGPPKRGGAGSRRVLIIGAGAAGLTAAHHLRQRGVEVRILEASSSFGGRMKSNFDFTDFPISLGAEWLHADVSELDAIVNDPDIEISTDTVGYSIFNRVGLALDGKLRRTILGPYKDRKFVGATWLSFFEDYVLPGLVDCIQFNTPVTEIDASQDLVRVTDAGGAVHVATEVIVTVPLSVLKRGSIRFVPELPERKQAAIDGASFWTGIKVFLEFRDQFFPVFVEFADSDTPEGQKIYYDASFGQKTKSHVLGLFAVGKQAQEYQGLASDDLVAKILRELDPLFDGIPSKTYLRHLSQDWSQEPFIHGAYLGDYSTGNTPQVLAESIGGRIFFAGEAYSRTGDWGAVHNAAQSARDAVSELLLVR